MDNRGVTLIELLIGLALTLVVMTAAYQVTISTTQANALLSVRTQLQSEALITNQLLLSRLREVCRVFPAGTAVTLPGSVAGVKRGASSTWRVETDPFVAFITPDESGSGTMFYAYYLLSRADYSAQLTGQQRILTGDPASGTQVLMEYRAPAPADACTPAPFSVPTGSALMVAEYVRSPTAAEPLFTVEDDQAVVYAFRFERPFARGMQVIPGLSSPAMGAPVVGRNVQY
ncbi:hypothetical protein GCM10017784_40210 [Deinococcus indicus]|uniref:PilW family protein n=1 Tax=Deinococcus indicus TaxID=223556 RepID=UPI00174EAF97|nr:prepilin-type N-terminal cleavage/methylation domain-containing protein [Deinococcus indicus]GHG41260.1 hypothetical protein GCM10017784_40210 [Deinococcus indicus]